MLYMLKFSKMSFLKFALLIASMILISASVILAQQEPSEKPIATSASNASKEPIAFVGHGAMFDQSGNEIAPTIGFIRDTQAWYRNYLVQKLTKHQRAQFDGLERRLTVRIKLDTQSQLVLNAHLLDWLIKTVKTRDSARILGKNNLIKLNLETKLPEKPGIKLPRSLEPFKIDPELAKRLAQASKAWPKGPVVALLSTSNGGQAYRDECAAAGVPIPPDIGTPDTTGTNGWVPRGPIPQSELFIVSNLQAEVMTYHSASPEGMCVTLPRFDASDKVWLDGVICMGKISKKVCFWDNEKFGNLNTFQRFSSGTTRTIVPFTDFGGGTEIAFDNGGMGGNCSDCHAGENPYIIHGAVLNGLAGTLPTFADDWHLPIVPIDTPLWPENPGPMNSPPSCKGCHGLWNAKGYAGRLPHLSVDMPGYCGAVLRSSIGALAPPMPGSLNPPPTMPQGAPGSLTCTPGLASMDPRYRACNGSMTQTCTPAFSSTDPRLAESDYPAAYQVGCTPEMKSLLDWCGMPASSDGWNRGDPHITTFNDVNYDFQGAGEFVAMRSYGGMEVQTRQTPVGTSTVPLWNAYTGLTSCVSLNTAFAARVGTHRVTYEPNISGNPDPSGMQLRVDGVLTTLGAQGFNLPGGGRIVKTAIGTGIEVFFPNQSHLIVSSNWWDAPQNKWYLNVDAVTMTAREGVMGAIPPGSWLPALPDGTTLGSIPANMHQRYVDLNQTFANAWRVSNATSLFDYKSGTSTAMFTNRSWPVENPTSCAIPRSTIPPAKPMDPRKAHELCGRITDKNMQAQCIFDTTVTGEAGFAKSYLISQQLLARARETARNGDEKPRR